MFAYYYGWTGSSKVSSKHVLCCLTYLIIAGFLHILSLHFTVLIHFDEYWISEYNLIIRVIIFKNTEWDELMHIHI